MVAMAIPKFPPAKLKGDQLTSLRRQIRINSNIKVGQNELITLEIQQSQRFGEIQDTQFGLDGELGYFTA